MNMLKTESNPSSTSGKNNETPCLTVNSPSGTIQIIDTNKTESLPEETIKSDPGNIKIQKQNLEVTKYLNSPEMVQSPKEAPWPLNTKKSSNQLFLLNKPSFGINIISESEATDAKPNNQASVKVQNESFLNWNVFSSINAINSTSPKNAINKNGASEFEYSPGGTKKPNYLMKNFFNNNSPTNKEQVRKNSPFGRNSPVSAIENYFNPSSPQHTGRDAGVFEREGSFNYNNENNSNCDFNFNNDLLNSPNNKDNEENQNYPFFSNSPIMGSWSPNWQKFPQRNAFISRGSKAKYLEVQTPVHSMNASNHKEWDRNNNNNNNNNYTFTNYNANVNNNNNKNINKNINNNNNNNKNGKDNNKNGKDKNKNNSSNIQYVMCLPFYIPQPVWVHPGKGKMTSNNYKTMSKHITKNQMISTQMNPYFYGNPFTKGGNIGNKRYTQPFNNNKNFFALENASHNTSNFKNLNMNNPQPQAQLQLQQQIHQQQQQMQQMLEQMNMRQSHKTQTEFANRSNINDNKEIFQPPQESSDNASDSNSNSNSNNNSNSNHYKMPSKKNESSGPGESNLLNSRNWLLNIKSQTQNIPISKPNNSIHTQAPNNQVNTVKASTTKNMKSYENNYQMQIKSQTTTLKQQPSFKAMKRINDSLIWYKLENTEIAKAAHTWAKDQIGCRFLQKKLEEESEFAIKEIYPNVLSHWVEIINDQFGNYLVQKFFEYLKPEDHLNILQKITPTFSIIGTSQYGTRVIQKIIDYIKGESITIILPKFIEITLPNFILFANDINGCHIVQKLWLTKNFDNTFAYEALQENIAQIANHKNGCCFIQKCTDKWKGEDLQTILSAISKKTKELLVDQYGNYVIQYVLKVNGVERNNELFNILTDNLLYYSNQKYSSNVIEKFFEYEDKKAIWIDQMLNVDIWKGLLFDSYGNYIVQKALSKCNKEINLKILCLIAPLLEELQALVFGARLYHKLIAQYPLLLSIKYSWNK